jgi:hypothetical protein
MLIRLSLHELFGEASQMLHELIDIQAGAGTCETPAQKWPPLLESKVNIRYSVRLTRSESKACLYERYWRRHGEATVHRFFEPLDFWVWRDGV